MGNFLPCLQTKEKLNCFDDPMRLFHRRKKAKRRGRIASTSSAVSRPLSVSEDSSEEEGEKGVIRVKVVLTKEEAARLLSMCMRGGEEKTLAQLMSQIESRHATAGTHGSSHGGWIPVLESIPEEYC